MPKKKRTVNFTFSTEKNLKTGHRCECKMIKILEKTMEKIFMTFCQAEFLDMILNTWFIGKMITWTP